MTVAAAVALLQMVVVGLVALGANGREAKSTKRTAGSPTGLGSDHLARLLSQYGCGPIQFAGGDNGLYELDLVFDHVLDLKAAGPRERFEAFARVVRDVLAQRWVRTEKTYERENPKRVYYLSMEFLIGRSLAKHK